MINFPTSLLASVKPDGTIVYREFAKRAERVFPLYSRLPGDCSASILPVDFEAYSIKDSDSPSAIAAETIFGTDVHLCEPTTDLTRIYDVVFCCFRRLPEPKDSNLADASILQNDDHGVTARLRDLYNPWET